MREQAQVQHTSGPWGRSGIFLTANGVTIAKAIYSVDGPSAETAFENARHILKCVNTHDELVEALKAFMAIDKSFATTCDKHLDEMAKDNELARAVKLARAALQKAGATQ